MKFIDWILEDGTRITSDEELDEWMLEMRRIQ